jgi:Cu(I)/Ag(I) efflux system membrane fusion protein
MPGETVHGNVDYVYPELNMETRTIRARITLAEPPAGVKPNMLAHVSLLGGAGEAVLNIPRSALIRGGSQDRVVVALGDGRFASRKVVAGPESGDRVTIREGLQEGEQVVVSAQFLLDSEANLDAGLDRLEGAGAGADPRAPQPDPHAGHKGP